MCQCMIVDFTASKARDCKYVLLLVTSVSKTTKIINLTQRVFNLVQYLKIPSKFALNKRISLDWRIKSA